MIDFQAIQKSWQVASILLEVQIIIQVTITAQIRGWRGIVEMENLKAQLELATEELVEGVPT